MFGNQQRSPAFNVIASYAIDWVGTLVLAGLLAIVNSVDGFRREFSLTDTSIQHTYATSERVPTWLLAVCAFLIPLAIIAAVSLGMRRSVWDFHSAFLGLVLTNALTLTITTLIKVTVGRPRPDLIDRCKPQSGAMNAAVYGLATQAVCTTPVTDHIIRDGFRSFPSGHASTAFAGLTFLSLYLAGKVHLFDSRGHALGAWIVLTPLVGAALIAVSRTEDYRHHATDVIAGGLLGFWVSVAIYLMYYPPLGHAQSHKPWAPRIYHPFSQGGAFDRFDDESAPRPFHTSGTGRGAHGMLSGVLGSGSGGNAALGPADAHVGGTEWAPVTSRSDDGYGAGPTKYMPAHSRDPSASNMYDARRTGAGGNGNDKSGASKPLHATGPRTGAHGYVPPVYADASALDQQGDASAAAGQGKEDVTYHPEFASRPVRGAAPANEVELGAASYYNA
ncbi:hypothetical protein OC834_004948 [Tilletia horrida]|nr:hypothetical protein OC834_004948 [Tilletia horrida]KAK0527372.1 hypothetical protein OC835_005000 [Tilletia horrida]